MKISFCLRVFLLFASTAVLAIKPGNAGAQSKSVATAAAVRPNVMSMASGAVLLSTTGEYGGGWIALDMLAATPGRGWSSPQGKPFPQAFVIELPQTYRLSSIALDNTGAQDSGYPGISARSVEVWLSTTAPDDGYKKIGAFEAIQGGRKEFALPAGSEANWVKLVVVSNWGNKLYTELMQVEAYGTPVGAAPRRPPLSGVYDTNYGPMQITDANGRVTGCYYNGGGQISGASDGRTMNVEWRQNQGTYNGTALMTLSSRGDFLNGLWYSGGQLQGTWFGKRRSESKKICDDATQNTLSQQLKSAGRAILYGVHFDSDSANLRPDSEPTLHQVAALMQAQAGLKLSIEGHTDSTNTAAYNLDLSRRRAQAVVAWLVKNGVTASRLSSEGYGSTKPVADNNSPQGRALNRRVELVQQK